MNIQWIGKSVDSRYAIISVELMRAPLLPNTGGSGMGRVVFAGVLFLFIALGMIVVNMKRRVS